MKIISLIVNTFFLTLLVGVALLFLVPLLPIEQNLEMRIVESGSMEPAITTGSLVMILPKENYAVGDVVTFKSATADVPTTHRIVDTYTENGRLWFITKGDANEDADTAAVARGDVIGTVRFDLPRAGYILDFARTPTGFMLLIVLPSLLLIIGEIEKIWREVRQRKSPVSMKGDSDEVKPISIDSSNSGTTRIRQMMDISRSKHHFTETTLNLINVKGSTAQTLDYSLRPLIIISATAMVCAIIVGSSFFGTTASYFNDLEVSTGNELTAIELDFDVLPDGSAFVFDDGVLMGDVDGAVVTVVSQTASSVDMMYDISAEFRGGSQLFCDSIIASSTSPFVYDGSISSLMAQDVEFPAPWSLAFSLDNSTSTPEGVCLVDVVFTAWHYEEESGQGYFDEERVPLSFSTVEPLSIQTFGAPQQLRVAALPLAPLPSATTSTSTASSTDSEGDDVKEEGQSDDSNLDESDDPVDTTDDDILKLETDAASSSDKADQEEIKEPFVEEVVEDSEVIEDVIEEETKEKESGGEEETKDEEPVADEEVVEDEVVEEEEEVIEEPSAEEDPVEVADDTPETE